MLTTDELDGYRKYVEGDDWMGLSQSEARELLAQIDDLAEERDQLNFALAEAKQSIGAKEADAEYSHNEAIAAIELRKHESAEVDRLRGELATTKHGYELNQIGLLGQLAEAKRSAAQSDADHRTMDARATELQGELETARAFGEQQQNLRIAFAKENQAVRPVVEAAKAWRAMEPETGRPLAEQAALIAAVDGLGSQIDKSSVNELELVPRCLFCRAPIHIEAPNTGWVHVDPVADDHAALEWSVAAQKAAADPAFQAFSDAQTRLDEGVALEGDQELADAYDKAVLAPADNERFQQEIEARAASTSDGGGS